MRGCASYSHLMTLTRRDIAPNRLKPVLLISSLAGAEGLTVYRRLLAYARTKHETNQLRQSHFVAGRRMTKKKSVVDDLGFAVHEYDHPQFLRETGDEESFGRTDNYAYVALAIGEWASGESFPDDPPRWAIQTCRSLYEEVNLRGGPVIEAKPGPSRYSADDETLEFVADILTNGIYRKNLGLPKRVSFRAAVRFVLETKKQELNQANYLRLYNNWRITEEHRRGRAAVRLHVALKKRFPSL